MVPCVVSPPIVEFTCQVTALFAVVLNEAENCTVLPVNTEAEVGVIVRVSAVPVVIVIFAVPDCVASEIDVAVMVTSAGLGTTAGAVYRPAVEMVPTLRLPPTMPFTDQKTPELLFATVAENCCVVLVAIEAVAGVTDTPLEEDDEELDLLPPPHAVSSASDTTRNSNRGFIY
jgi:hypothetical protein